MRVIVSLLLFVFVMSVSSLTAHAQEQKRFAPRVNFSMNKYGESLVGPRYRKMVERIIKGERAGFNFELFRIYYGSSELYDPAAIKAKKQLLNYAYGMVNAGSAAEKELAQHNYRAVLHAHMGNIEVVAQALSLSMQNEIYGDPEMFAWVMDGLIKSVLRSGDGNTLSSLYVLVTLAEEKYVLKNAQVKVLKTERTGYADKILNIYKVQSTERPEPYFMVFDISKPMNYIDYLDAQKQKDLGEIRRQ